MDLSIFPTFLTLEKEIICLSYLGNFTDEITSSLVELSESYLRSSDDLSKLSNKVSFLIAESFQNVVKHGGSVEGISSDNHKDFFQINVLRDRVALTSCNLIKIESAEVIKSKIDQVNNLTSDQLRVMYTEILGNGKLSERNGAGLGLIEMARKSGLPIKSEFKITKNNLAQFFLSLEIIKSKSAIEPIVPIAPIIAFYEKLVSDNVHVLYRGDFSKDSINSLIGMFEKNFLANSAISPSRMKEIVMLIEALHNISKHGALVNNSKEGVFIVRHHGEHLQIQCGNFVSKHVYENLREHLDAIRNLTKDELVSNYKKRLLEKQIGPEGNCGLGLYEIARNSQGNFNYHFDQLPAGNYFFTLTIN